MVRVSSTADVPQPSPAAGTQSTSGTSEDNGKNLKQLIHEISNRLVRLAAQAFWPTVDTFVAKYQESPFQALLLATMFLLALMPLSAIVAIIFLFATLATILFMIALQVTLVCLSIFVAACLSVVSILKLGASGIRELTKELRALASGYFQSTRSSRRPTWPNTNASWSSAYFEHRGRRIFTTYRDTTNTTTTTNDSVVPELEVTLALLRGIKVALILLIPSIMLMLLFPRPRQCPTIPPPPVCEDPSVRDFIKKFVRKKF